MGVLVQGKIRRANLGTFQWHQWDIKGQTFWLSREPDIDAPELLPWDQADHYALELAPPEGKILVLGERFGAISLGLGPERTVVWTDSSVSQQAIEGNWAQQNEPRQGLLVTSFAAIPKEPYAAVVIKVPRDFASLAYLLRALGEIIAAHTPIHLVALQRHLPHSFVPWLQEHCGEVTPHLGVKKAKAFTVSHVRFAQVPNERQYVVEGLTLKSHPLVFSSGHLDEGSAFLLANLKPKFSPTAVVDLGCGGGVLAAVAAKKFPEASIVATDESYAAVALAAGNFRDNHLKVQAVTGNCGDSIGDESADLVLLNPPFHRGTTLTDELTRRMVAQASRMLRSRGMLYLVCNRGLLYEPMLRQNFGNVSQIAEQKRFKILVAQK